MIKLRFHHRVRPWRLGCHLLASALALSSPPAQAQVSVVPGWNLVGNSFLHPINVTQMFGDASKFYTVWKWNASAARWAFYAPSLSPQELSSYAQSKGYDVLSSIESIDGFWVNAKQATTLTDFPTGIQLYQLGPNDFVTGWNLLASADKQTPADLNRYLAGRLNPINKSVITLWAWDASRSNWKFYAPALAARGGSVLNDYIAAKKYLAFESIIGDTEGYWVNIGPPQTVTSTQDPTMAMPALVMLTGAM